MTWKRPNWFGVIVSSLQSNCAYWWRSPDTSASSVPWISKSGLFTSQFKPSAPSGRLKSSQMVLPAMQRPEITSQVSPSAQIGALSHTPALQTSLVQARASSQSALSTQAGPGRKVTISIGRSAGTAAYSLERTSTPLVPVGSTIMPLLLAGSSDQLWTVAVTSAT